MRPLSCWLGLSLALGLWLGVASFACTSSDNETPPDGGSADADNNNNNSDATVDSTSNGDAPDAETSDADVGDVGDGGPQATLVVRIDAEPMGANCAAGGKAVRKGADLDDDGVLDDAEITSTTYVCSPVAGTTLFGDYTIVNSTDLAPLTGVTKITGTLTIQAPGLPSVSLPDLVEIGGAFNIQSSAGTTSVSLPALTTVNTSLYVASNDSLTTLALPALIYADNVHFQNAELVTLALPKLITTHNITFVGNLKLTSPGLPGLTGTVTTVMLRQNGFTSLTGLEGITRITSSLYIDGNASLTNLTALANVRGTIDSLAVVNNAQLTNLNGLGGIKRLSTTGGDSIVANNLALTSVAGLSGLATVDDTLRFDDNNSLTVIVLPSLATVGKLLIDEPNLATHPLTSIQLPSLTSTKKNFEIRNCDSLTALQAPNLASIDGEIIIAQTPALQTPNFAGLTHVGTLRLVSVPVLSYLLPQLVTAGSIEISGISASSIQMTKLTSVNDLRVVGNDTLTTLQLPKLTTVSGLLRLESASLLTTFQAPMLASVGTLTVMSVGLTSLSGLSQLQTASQSFTVASNSSLTTLGMTALKNAPLVFAITNNTQLETCQAKALQAQLNAQPANVNISGNKNPAAICP